jgi:hypothetical protein
MSLLLLMALSCDGGFRVKGTISGGGPVEECRMELRAAGDRDLLEARRVVPPFLETFVTAPGKERYFFTFLCEGFEPYETSVFELGGVDDYRQPLELNIKLQREN